MRYVLYSLLIPMLFGCYKEPLYTPTPQKKLTFYVQSTTPYAIRHGHFRLQLMASVQTQSGKHIENKVLKEQYYWRNSLPFDIIMTIKQSRIDSLQNIETDHRITYYLKLQWDSDGNGKFCRGDLGFDYQMCLPDVTLTEKRQKLYLKTKPD